LLYAKLPGPDVQDEPLYSSVAVEITGEGRRPPKAKPAV
jgi:hypothetical protein